MSIRNHMVNHIDIEVEGEAGIKMPLAYGTYRLEEVDGNGELTGRYRPNPLEVTAENKVTIEVRKKVDITEADIRNASITTTVKNGDTKVNIDNAYIVTGYSKNMANNQSAGNSIAQVRLEGNFKVANLDPVPWGTNENDPGICAQRLQNRIYYDIAVTKPVTFRLIYTDPDTGTKYAVLKNETTPFDVTVDVTLSTSFDFWDTANTCPGVRGIFSYDVWQTGVIPDIPDGTLPTETAGTAAPEWTSSSAHPQTNRVMILSPSK